tara:strand:- start:447 stop:656 length:210 start_codon:yes stop_codon:yes gene_type:complete
MIFGFLIILPSSSLSLLSLLSFPPHLLGVFFRPLVFEFFAENFFAFAFSLMTGGTLHIEGVGGWLYIFF